MVFSPGFLKPYLALTVEIRSKFAHRSLRGNLVYSTNVFYFVAPKKSTETRLYILQMIIGTLQSIEKKYVNENCESMNLYDKIIVKICAISHKIKYI